MSSSASPSCSKPRSRTTTSALRRRRITRSVRSSSVHATNPRTSLTSHASVCGERPLAERRDDAATPHPGDEHEHRSVEVNPMISDEKQAPERSPQKCSPEAARGANAVGAAPRDVAQRGALVVRRLEALAAILSAADASTDQLGPAEAIRDARERVGDELKRLDGAAATHDRAGLPGRWPEPWDDSDDPQTRRPTVIADRIARGEGTAEQIRALAAGYRWWTGRVAQLQRNHRESFVDALMLELAEGDPAARAGIARALARLGEDGCAALCEEVREIEDAGGLWIVETRQRRTRGGVWFALLKARHRWARVAVAGHRKQGTAQGQAERPGSQRVTQGGSGACGSAERAFAAPPGDGTRAAAFETPPRAPSDHAARHSLHAPQSGVRPCTGPASPGTTEVIVLRRRGGAR